MSFDINKQELLMIYLAMGERLNLTDDQSQKNNTEKRQSFLKEVAANVGFALTGNPNINYKGMVDHVWSVLQNIGIKIRNNSKKKD